MMLLPLLLSATAHPAAADPGWWDLNWQRRSPTTTSTAYTWENFPVRVWVDYDSDMAFENFQDVRFIENDDSTSLSFFLENYVTADHAIFRVLLPGTWGNGREFWMYYSNAGAGDASDFGAVFNGVLAWWPMYEGTGDILHDSAGTYDGARQNLADGWAAGKYDNALDFDAGSSQYVSQGTLLDTVSSSGAIELWFKLDVEDADRRLLTKINDETTRSFIDLRYDLSDNKLILSYDTPDITEVNLLSQTIDTGTWYHLLVRWGSDNLAVFLDGVLDVSNSTTSAMAGGTTRDFVLGAFNWGGSVSSYWDGILDELRVWERSPSAAEIVQLARDRPTASVGEEETTASWHLIETWTGTVSAPVQWNHIETWTGTINAPAQWNLIETWTGTVSASIAPAQWRLIETWTGTVNAPASWNLIETWAGTVQTTGYVWNLIETWTAIVKAPAEWSLIETWSGTVNAPTQWNLIETWTGTVTASAQWSLIESWTGLVQDPAVWQLIENWIGTVEASVPPILAWQLIETWTGTVVTTNNPDSSDGIPPPGAPDWTPPPKQDDWVAPGQREDWTPPGKQEDWIPLGQRDDWIPPGQRDDWVPPGKREDWVPPGKR